MALRRCLCLSYWIPLLVPGSIRQASINLVDLRKLTQTPTLQLLALELVLFKKHMMKWQTPKFGRQFLLGSGKTNIQPNVLGKGSLWTIILIAEHFYSPASILQCTRDVLTNELCKMKAKTHLLLKESFIFIFLWVESPRDIHPGREPDGTCVQSKSVASNVVFSSEHSGNKMHNSIV